MKRGIRPVEEIVQVSCGLAFCGNGTPKKENEHIYRRGDVYWNDDILFGGLQITIAIILLHSTQEEVLSLEI